MADAVTQEDSSGTADGVPAGSQGALAIEFRHVTKQYRGQDAPAIDDLSLTVPAGETCCLVGPSGGGKTTAMKLVNRLIEPTSGDILIGGRSVLSYDVTTLRRDIGYVIQQVGLFPHMTIGANIGTIPRLLGWDRQRIAERTDRLLDLVRLDRSYAKRYPAQLSGGQQQRIGLARALAADPPVMLMDEPFGALDPITRAEIQDEFLSLENEIRKTVIFVTHDIDEAIKMGDKIAVLRPGGKLAQYGSADELLGDPVDDFVADCVGADRGLKRLSLRSVGELADPGREAPPGAPSVSAGTSLRVGLSVLLSANADVLEVTKEGRPAGAVTLAEIREAAGS
jgi:osmoprotectant transport system ATP-binding protein